MKKTFRKYFIPHKENNYLPHFLHTKRMIFYSSFFITLKGIVVLFVILLPVEVFTVPDIVAEHQRKIISMTNSIRQEKGLSLIDAHWKLHSSSDLKAKDMGVKEYFAHVGPDGRGLEYYLGQVGYQYKVAGENLAMGFSTPEQVVQAWLKSPTHYANLVDPDYTDIGVSAYAGVLEETPTTYVAQHFGREKGVPAAEIEVVEEKTRAVSEEIEENVLESASNDNDILVEPEEVKNNKTSTIEIQENENNSDIDITSDREEEVLKEVDVRNIDIEEPNIVENLIDAPTITESIEKNKIKENEENTNVSTTTIPIAQTKDTKTDNISDTKSFVYAKENSQVLWREIGPRATEIIFEVYLAGEIQKAEGSVLGYTIDLDYEPSENIYRGKEILPVSKKSLFDVAINPSLTVRLADNSTVNEIVPWNTVLVNKPTTKQKYDVAKSTFNPITSLFNVSRYIYIAFLGLFAFALFLKIVIEIRIQHHHVIAQTLLLMGLLAWLITV